MSNAKKALEEARKEFGIKTKTTTKTNNNGKQSTSASQKTNTTKNNNAPTKNRAKEALEEARKEFGISYSSAPSSKKYTDYNAETKNAYESVKDKMSSKTTITSDLTDSERKARIKEIDQELTTLNAKISGYSRAKAYGTSKAMQEAEKKDKERLAQLTKEKKELERVGTFSAFELKQFEIDDAKANLSKARNKVNSFGARPSADSAEAYRQAVSDQYKAQEELKGLKWQKELYDDITKYGDAVHEDNNEFGQFELPKPLEIIIDGITKDGSKEEKEISEYLKDFDSQWRANYRSGKLSRTADKASNRNLDNPTEENKEIAYAYDALSKAYMQNNEKALDDENVRASWLTKDLAGYLPQFEDQIVPELVGGTVGGIIGYAVGAPKEGWALGSGIGSGIQSCGVIRGSVYRELLSQGVDEETAKELATDDALIESLIEGGETALSWLFAGGGKAKTAIYNAAKSSVAKGSTNAATKFVANMATKAATKATTKAAKKVASQSLWKTGIRMVGGIVLQGATEGIEEFVQGGVSRATREKAWASNDKEIGRFGEGNIDLHNRPIYRNEDGSISTVDSVTFEVDGKYVVLPTIVRDENGKAKRLETDEDIFAHYIKTGEYLGEFGTLEEANGYANKLHYAQAYRYSDNISTDADDNIVVGGGKVIADALLGGNEEAFGELAEQFGGGFRVGVMLGGSHATVNNIITHYANAKTVKNQNEIADAIIKNEKDLSLIIEQGKASGEGTVSAKLAEEVEQAKENGTVTREQVKRLIETTAVYVEAEKQSTTPDPLEQAAQEVVEKRNATPSLAMLENRKNGKVNAEMLETLSRHNVPITTAEAKKVTGFGERGSELVANATNAEGATFDETVSELRPSYLAGFNNPDLDIKDVARTFASPAQADAYTAGQIDAVNQNAEADIKAKNARVFGNESGVVENEHSTQYTPEQIKMADTIGKDLGAQVSFEEQLLIDTEAGAEANAWHEDGEIKRSNTSDNKFIEDIMEESLHRMSEMNTEEVKVLKREIYEFVVERDRSRGIDEGLAFGEEKAEHDDAGITLNTSGIMEEVSVGELSKMLFTDEKAWNKWRERLDSNSELRTAWQKFMDVVSEIIEKIKRLLKEGSFSKEARAKVNKDLATLERFKGLYTEAYKATRDAVVEKTKSQGEKAQKNTDTKDGKDFSLSSTKISRLSNIILGMKKIKKVAGNKEIRIATDQFSVDKAIHSKKGRTAREINARIKAIPNFDTIIKQSVWSHTDTEIVGVDKEAKKGVIAMHFFKTAYNGYDVEIVVRDKGNTQFLYEVKFIENKKSSQQGMPTDVDSPAPKGDVENDTRIPQTPEFVKGEFSDTSDVGLDGEKNFSLKGKDIDKLPAEEKRAVEALGEGAEAITNENGDMLIATNKNKNTVMYSIKTHKKGGRKALEKALIANGHTKAEIEQTLAWVDDAADYLTILAAGYAKSHNYTALSNHLVADVITNVKTGKQVISAIVNNGEYPVNIDLALICKKRVAYMNLMNRLIEDGIFDKVNYGGEAIAKVNDLLRMDGFETACLGCFVESRRLQFQTWAETIVSEWNAEVDKRKNGAGSFGFAEGKAKLTDAEMDALSEELKGAGKKNAQGNLNLGQGSVQTRMGRLLDKVPSLQKHLTVADLLTPNGLTALRAYDSNLFSLVKSRYGAASPKIVQDYNPYASEIAMMTFASVKNITSKAIKGADSYRRKVINEMGGNPVKQKGETTAQFKERKAEFTAKVEDEAMRRYLYDIGGARIQSFSDFMIENVFDYIQIFADLSAKRLPLHGYTKEIIALRLFGMTGAKWNGSWIAHVDRGMGKEYAGLLPASEAKNGNAILVHTEDGDYAIGFDDYARHKATNKKSFIQSIGMKDMMALQLDPRYSHHVGSITIGVSDKQILAMLDSPYFRFVIPYHSSGMLPQFAKLVGVDLYNDYTDYQNTKVKQWYDAQGNPCDPVADVDVDTSYNFNAEVQKTGDAKKAAENYLKWCEKKHPVYGKGKKLIGFVTFSPKFSDSPYGTDFTKHENYYKLLEDFNSYDNITEESSVQGAVTMNFPSEQNRLTAKEMETYKERLRETGVFSDAEIEKYSEIANKTFKELIADEVKGRAEYQEAQAPKWENTVKNIEKMLLGDHKRELSLKGGISHKELSDTIADAQKGKKGAAEKLAQYVESGKIRTKTYDELIEKYGIIPSGERPHRDIQVPRKTSKNKKVSQTVRTILEAGATPDEAVPTIEKMVEDGVFSYESYSDKEAISNAEGYIKKYGWSESYKDWMDAVNKGEVSKDITTTGWVLYNNAANRAATETGDARKQAIQESLNILDAMVRHQRSAAQALQATRILKKLSPETQLYGVQKSVQAFQKELTDKYGKKAPELKIDEELAEQFINAQTPEERAEVEKEIYKDIGRQMPSRFIDKWNAWRYLAMLGNPRTHIRNILGNAGFAPVVIAKDLTATAIESVVHRVSGKKTVRGKSIVWGSKADRALLKAAWSDYDNVSDMVSNGGKYNDYALANQQIEEGRQIFKFKPLEWARKGNSKALEAEDVWFSKPHYAYALAQYCKANNITAEQIARGKAIAPAREYAIKEAQKATYKDTNAFSQFVSELGRKGTKKNIVTKSASAVLDGILPFRKTPANILVRGLEYSPIGLLNGLTYDLVQVGKGKMSSSEAIDHISAGLTGTGLLALGVCLAAQGLVRGHGEDEEKEKKFKEMQGHQAYSLELPSGESVTLDWLAPEALPFFVGVNVWESTNGADEETNFSAILQSLTHITEPMLEMSCLQGVNDLFEGIGYASSNDTSALMAVLTSAVTSYLTQGLPTLGGQAERTSEDERMTTYTEKNEFLTGDMQYTLGKASAKIPFWDYNQIPYIDAWGRKEASGTALKRGLNNFLNPAYTSTIESSKMEEELLRLYDKTGEDGVFPERADKYFMVDGERKDLTADEYVRYATLKGQKSYKAVSDLVNSRAYKKLSDEEKVKAIKEAYDYANQKAKQAVSNYKPETWVSKADKFGSNVGNYLSFKTEYASEKDDNGGKLSKKEVADIVLDMAQNDSEIWDMYLSVSTAEKDTTIQNAGVGGEEYMNVLKNVDKYDKPNKNGNLGTYTNDEITTAIINTNGLSNEERAVLWQALTGSSSTKNNPWRGYLN